MSINLRWKSDVAFIDGRNIYIDENTGANQEILDFGNDPLNGWSANGNSTYKISNASNPQFNFDESSGELFYKPDPDYERYMTAIYVFTVEVSRPLKKKEGGKKKDMKRD